MSDMKCFGCGAVFQSTDSQLPGYIDEKLLLEGQDDILCKRCFRLKHYNEAPEVTLSSDDFRKTIGRIAEEDALIINVIDLFDFSGSMISGLNRLVGNEDIILVANKRDILPKVVNNQKIKHWLRQMVKDYGFRVLDVVIVSAEKGHGIHDLMTAIETYRKNRNVYIVGCTNVGKSTLINRIIRTFTPEQQDLITVSHFPGTTLDFIEIPLTEDHALIDTPGIVNEHQYAHVVSKETLKMMTPKKEIKAKVYQLNPKQTLFVSGLARFDFINGERSSFVCYFSNELYIHRTKLEQADRIYKEHKGDLLSPPKENEIEQLGLFKRYTFTLPNEKTDIVISGLGFITAHAPNAQIAIHVPETVGVILRPSLI